MFNLRFAAFSTCIASLLSFSTAAAAEPAAPARNDSEISAILDRQKPDPSRVERNRAAADAQPPARGQLGQFYYRRAQARVALGRNEEAIADLQQAMSHGGNLQLEVARYSQLLAQQYRVVGKIKAAIDTELALVKKVEGAPRGKGLLFGIYLRTQISYMTLGDLKQAEVYLNKNLALLAESRRWPNVDVYRSSWESNVENGRARLLLRRGKYHEAEVAFHRAHELQRDALAKSASWPNKPPADLMEASIDLLIMQEGGAKARQGRLREAESDIRRALLNRLKTVGKYHLDTAQVTLSLSNLSSEQSQFADAEALARTSVEIYRALDLPEEATAHAFALNQLAATLFSQRKWEEAAQVYDRIDVATERWEPTRAAELRLGYARIFTSYAARRTDRGIEAAKQLVEFQTKRVGDKHFDTAMAQAILGAGLTFARRDAEALAAYRKAMPILLAASREDADDAAEARAAAETRMQVVIELYLTLLSRNPTAMPDVEAETFRLAEAIRGRSVEKALAASSARALARQPALADLARKEQDLEKEISGAFDTLNEMLSLPPEERNEKDIAALRGSIDKLRAQRVAAKRDIQRRFPGYADLVAPKAATIDDIRSSLRPDEAFLSVYLGRYGSFVWAVPKQGPVGFKFVHTNLADMNGKVRRLRRALEPQAQSVGDIPPFDLKLAYELYDLLLKPVEAGWKSAKSLIVVANGDLGLLPLSLLPTAPTELKAGEGGAIFANYRDVPWLARTHAVTLVPSAATLRTLRALPAASAKRDPLIGFGDPLFNDQQAADAAAPPAVQVASATRGIPLVRRNTPQTRNVENADLGLLPRLPDTASELKSIALALQADPSKVLNLGVAANEDTVKKASLSKYRVIVFATHGLVPGELSGLTQPALALSAPSVAKAQGDGLLTMEEILTLKLDADWVVLSACNTGAGAGAGAEAASGLGRAFFYAGTRAVLVTNWAVHSASAKELVTDIFRRQAADPALSRGEALRQAAVALIDSAGFTDETGKTLFTYAHPLFWAPYSIIGDSGATKS
jgi:CHAT domain-containing protein/tetratricopeptide (TPR) repeat protein